MLAQKYWGSTSRLKEIYEANKDIISDPNKKAEGAATPDEAGIPDIKPDVPEAEATDNALVKVKTSWCLGTKEWPVFKRLHFCQSLYYVNNRYTEIGSA